MFWSELKHATTEALNHSIRTIVKDDDVPVYFLRATLLIFSLSSLFFFLLPESNHNRYANVYASAAGVVLCIAAAHRAWYIPILHLTGLLIVSLTVFAAANAGGINAIVLIWLTILPLMALIVGGLQAGVAWSVVVQIVLLGVLLSTSSGLLSPDVPMSTGLLISALFNWLLCLISPFLVVLLYAHLHTQRAALLHQENNALVAAQQALTQAQAHKDEFIAAIGHELRTPMSAILGLNSMLSDKLTHNPEAFEAAAHIRTSTKQLLSLINNILDFSQLQAGEMQLRPSWMHPAQSLHTVIEQLQDAARQKNIQVTVEQHHIGPKPIWLDAIRFEQVATNLVKNAIQHASTGVLVRLTQQHSPHSLRLEVCDDGKGPAHPHPDQLFNHFMLNTADTTSCEQGAGLGLTICKLLLDLHQGRIGTQPYLDRYTCFWAEWPTPTHDAPQADEQPLPQLASQPLCIAIVDDYPINLMINKLQVSKAFAHATVHCLNSAYEAQAFLSNNPCDILFVDFLMPGLNGFELAQWVRSQPEPIRSVALIGLTASSLQQDWDNGIRAGMSAILTKPVEHNQLLKAVNQALAQQARSRPSKP
jgi:signal transduction histidine kinase/CheY-like chemotaxis protein